MKEKRGRLKDGFQTTSLPYQQSCSFPRRRGRLGWGWFYRFR
ncbi:hypothetical protein NEISICOT_03546 [Neisseria sicca ATCC 29256]|uniref:Uncharacterized protein n=1 Tax=Neisseria sicca ATCC 29256 TaxID=547045 RepID=C6MAG4_NEISI|nr:hypothetical protein NEISICOT_03546 [Neisseria sicca ATCC 29256]